MRECSVLIHAAEDVPGQWIAHCLNWDLISQGDSPSHAAKSMAEVIALAIDEDASEGLRAEDRGPAPATYWDVFRRTHQDGARVAAGDVDRLAQKSRLVVAAVSRGRRERSVATAFLFFEARRSAGVTVVGTKETAVAVATR